MAVEATSTKLIRRAIIIGALGYFIDVFDIQLFAVLRVSSLTDLGVTPDRLPIVAGYILNVQMLGMILGGFLWGWLGDRFGRLRALYGSILIYSIGTLLCAIVHDPVTYGFYRFFTGFGLAGETGAAVTLVAELMPAGKRVWGIIILAGFAFFGPAVAVGISWLLDWRTTYIVAGVMGLLLLVLRKSLSEPLLFSKLADRDSKLGSWALLAKRKPAITLLYCLLMGAPLSYGWNFLNFFSTEIGHTMLIDSQSFNPKLSMIAFYLGTAFGDGISGALTQFWGSRRKAIGTFLLLGWAISSSLLIGGPIVKLSTSLFYTAYFLIGISGGFWILMTTVAAEHFGTNIRATTSIVVTNLVRGFTIPLIFSLQMLKPMTGIDNGAVLIAMVIYPVALLALSRLKETHGTDLDYLEVV
jgi:MFS family permease